MSKTFEQFGLQPFILQALKKSTFNNQRQFNKKSFR